MARKSLIYGILFLFIHPLFAQKNVEKCAFEQIKQDIKENYPFFDLKNNEKKILSEENIIQERNEINIPIVVHVVWNNASENISDAQILSQIEVLNKDFNALNDNLGTVPAEFKPLIANVGIQFYLAKTDEKGNPSKGITRTQTTYEGIGSRNFEGDRPRIKYDDGGGKNAWNTQKFLNIWIGNIDDGYLGYTYLPFFPRGTDEDGIVIDYRYFGAIGTAAKNTSGRTATHEIGHYLGLEHIFGPGNGNGCAADDGIEDTPLQDKSSSGCPSFPHKTCNGITAMTMNYMDYSEDACMSMFTNGQKARMLTFINQYRKNLISPNNPDIADDDKLTLFPNPSQEFTILKLNSSNIEPYFVDVFDLVGKKVYASTLLPSNLHVISTFNWTRGYYLVKIYKGDYTKTLKLLKI